MNETEYKVKYNETCDCILNFTLKIRSLLRKLDKYMQEEVILEAASILESVENRLNDLRDARKELDNIIECSIDIKQREKELYDQIKEDEGFELKPYYDKYNKLTIGYGRNLSDNGISACEAEFMLHNDVENAKKDLLSVISTAGDLSKNRYNALVNLMFNLGKTRFLSFKKMIKAVQEEDFDKAAYELFDSKWRREDVGKPRSNRLIKMLKEG